jgi:hypothetical protein
MSVTYLGNIDLHISETQKKNVHFIQLDPEIVKSDYISHHILLADCSGSMCGNLKTLKEKIHATCDTLMSIPNSYVSVITYSGHNQTERILSAVKCDNTTFQMTDLHQVIDSKIYIKGVTVISEPLNQSIDICQTLAKIADKHHIALFTDGCLVPMQWNSETEERKCFDVAKYCNEHGVFLNAIGFGQYYDREFLQALVSIAGNGAVLHIDYIKDYFDVILNAIRKVNEEYVFKMDLSAVGTLDNVNKIFNIGTSQMDTTMSVRTINPLLDIYAVIDSEYLLIDGQEYQFEADKPMEDDFAIQEFYYSLARFYMQEDDLDNYEFIVRLLGDIGLLEQTDNCFSFIEKGNALNKISNCLFNLDQRYLKGKHSQINTLNENLCILEILQAIITDPDSTLYWDMNTPYHRVTQKAVSIDDFVAFRKDENDLLPVFNISIGSEKLNIGIKVKINGTVTDSVNHLSHAASIHRDYNIVNGGNINVPYLNAQLSETLFNQFKDEGILLLTLNTYVPTQIYTINLIGVKSVNKRILKSKTQSEIAQLLYDIADLKCEQWAFNQVIKELLGDKTKLHFSNLSFEEQELRSKLRIDEKGIYSPASVEKDLTSPFEIYPAIHMPWDIARFPEKKVRENYVNQIKQNLINLNFNIDNPTDNELDDMIKSLNYLSTSKKGYMRELEFTVNSIRIASALINKSPFVWDEVTEKSKKTNDKILNRNMVIGDKVVIKKKLLNDILIEEKKWTLLIKAN